MSEQHNFHDAILCQPANLLQNILRLPAALPSAHIRHNTVTAKIIAAEHNVDARLKRIFPLARQILDNLLRFLPHVCHSSVRLDLRIEKLRQFVNIVRAENEVDKRITFLYPLHFVRLLHHAAAERYLHTRIRFLMIFQIPQPPINFQVSIFPYGTRIVHNKIGYRPVDFRITDIFQYRRHLLRVLSIHLTSQRLHRHRKRTT